MRAILDLILAIFTLKDRRAASSILKLQRYGVVIAILESFLKKFQVSDITLSKSSVFFFFF